jgi:tetratricopeptide (TPR) repeat protein
LEDARETAQSSQPAEPATVPAWLAVLVLFLLVAVVAVGGFIVRGLVDGGQTPEQSEIAKWQQRVEQDPGDMNARLSLGYAYQVDKQYDKALAQYRQVLQTDPHETAALYNTGVIYLALGLDKQGERSLWAVLEENPKHVLAAKALGEFYASKHQYRSLITAVRPAVLAQPEMADLQYLMGLAYENLGKIDWSRARYQLALKYAPDMKEARDALRRLGGAPIPGSETSAAPASAEPTGVTP